MSEIENETLEQLIARYKSARNEINNLNPEEISNIAIGIVQDVKILVENIFLKDIDEAFQYLSEYYKDYLLSCKEKSYGLDLFDNPSLFYKQLQSYSHTHIRLLIDDKQSLKELKNNFNNSFLLTNFSILTDLLLEILKSEKNAYKENIIKSDISILIETITSKATRITNSNTLFYCFINELKEKFNIKKEIVNSEFIKKMNESFKVKANEKLLTIKSEIFEHILKFAIKIIFQYNREIEDELPNAEKTKNYSKIDNLLVEKNKISKFYNEIKNNKELYKDDLIKIRNKSMELNIYSCFEYYSKILLENNSEYKECTGQYILENILLPFKINDIDLNKDEEIKIVYNIPSDFLFEPKDKYYNTFLGKYIEIKEELKYVQQRNYEKEITEIINDDNFIKGFFQIISNDIISSFFQAKIKFGKDYGVEFVENDEFDIFLKDNYLKFINDINKNYNKFRDFIIIKQICYKIPAMTDSTMRIYINPIYEISENIQKDPIQLKSVLKSAILILLIYELFYFLKAYSSENEIRNYYSMTPREKKSGKYLIFYLFNTCFIKSINLSQSSIINESSTWNNLNILRKIFENNDVTPIKEGDTLDLYLAEKDEEIYLEKRTEYCLW